MNLNNHNLGRSLFGIAAIALGGLFLLNNLGLVEAREVLRYWPALFIVVGAIKILQTRSSSSLLVGGAMIVFGALFTLDRADIIDFSMRQMWPLVMIAAGLAMIFKRNAGKAEGPAATLSIIDSRKDSTSENRIDATAIMGGFQRAIVTTDFRGGEITAVMGGCEIDLRHASMQGEAVIDVFAMWGGVEIKVPSDWTVILAGTPILGGFVEKTLPPQDNAKRLVVRGYAIMGGVEVTN